MIITYMIYALKGKIEEIGTSFVVLTVAGGESYKVFMPARELRGSLQNQEVRLFTCLFVKESGVDLYGFLSAEERSFFELLNTVSGVGPKAALGVLGLGPINQIKAAIKENKPESLTKSFGIGKKTAERIVVELKDKIKEVEGEAPEWDEDIYDALIKLGYRRDAAKEAIKKISNKTTNVNDRLKEALNNSR